MAPIIPDDIISFRISVRGLVQGVGFRPFVYRLAQHYRLRGWVMNTTNGVIIKAEGLSGHMAYFVNDLRNKAPVVSHIEEIVIENDIPGGIPDFSIEASQDLSDETSEICPDIAVCPDCLNDLKNQSHRLDYPFINCTNCGPRFSIIQDFPYDRAKTTMAPFVMCPVCSNEYNDLLDRRFHAQPVACNQCGPHYTMHRGGEVLTSLNGILDAMVRILENSGIIALKGTGGFHLMCNALDEAAVNRLRNLKRREGKPFAVMFRDIDSVKHYTKITETEERALTSWQRPVVILENTRSMAKGVTLGLNTLGAFLPYMPIHYLLFERLSLQAVVLTSGNIADEPILISNEGALAVFGGITDAVVTYNRDIYNRTDDSVLRIISGKERIVRRSRGYVPAPVKLDSDVEGILAAGAELSNCFCLGKGNRAYLSQHIGDLKNQETYAFYEESVVRFQQLFRVTPSRVVADLHPDYLSSRYARNSGLEIMRVQHHHAHIASCMAENGIDEPVIGLAFDGTGLGTDGHIWGGELMICDYDGFKRYCHFAYMPMPGGDKAALEPWRMGIALLWQAYGTELPDCDVTFLQEIDRKTIQRIMEAMEKKINCPFTSGAGRLFDAVAAITGLCVHSKFHAEAPMRLESAIIPGIADHYDFEIADTISFIPAIRQICCDVRNHTSPGIIAARFHNTIAEASFRVVKHVASETGIRKVVFSGGTFQNKYLLEKLESLLVDNNFIVYTHSKVPCNDGGIALGQLAIAARRVI